MAYDLKLADRIRAYLADIPGLDIEEKEMFKGLTFMVNEKMCVCVSGDEMMVRFDPALHDTFAERQDFRPMTSGGRVYTGYGYISPDYVRSEKDFTFWMQQCLDFNPRAKASGKKKK
ncbi:MAG: RNA methyltransferase [Dyadobacter sp. 50-39]|uniref:TfoX/Sxy family protein n=1 Tax=Dyadobacter sp. 50-39 TaxID=1895756 RepID=UPI00095C82AA|nr:TfoX/Sxy family protein [Dyadobacter sp. 50-39]OJV20509.1 MAG: RNA methyltransferase [Dyadobacter sp. 50-39]